MAGADAAAQHSQGESVHERAKSASLVVAIVTFLVGADPLDIRNGSHVFRPVDYIAIGLWIVAIVLFLGAQALAEGKREHRFRGHTFIFDDAKASLVAAVVVSGIAGALTISAVVAKALGRADDRDLVLLRVTSVERARFQLSCGEHARLYGTVRTADFNNELIVLKLSTGKDDVSETAKPHCDDIRVPRSAILTVVEHPCKFSPRPRFCPPE
jgi:hypothetical protein